MKPAPGTYALMLRSLVSAEIPIGRWGLLSVEPGYYIYVGSAFGPGGVRARVLRHYRKAKRTHWHIDYLRETTEAVCVWCSYERKRLEHAWARAFERMPGASCIAGFGSSDCSCAGHLFAMPAKPGSAEITSAIGRNKTARLSCLAFAAAGN